MPHPKQPVIRDFILQCLAARTADTALDDRESLFLSGRLDSLAVTQLVVFLEDQFQIDFSEREFDVGALDSVEQIAQFAATYSAQAAE